MKLPGDITSVKKIGKAHTSLPKTFTLRGPILSRELISSFSFLPSSFFWLPFSSPTSLFLQNVLKPLYFYITSANVLLLKHL
ncbi:MAG TPA: hypothetical protein DDZ05_03570 [Candidatus Blackburnbacteria bacterium]|nr:hypothetical protein [Candidatus Blackburnbacteria bacterium]